MQSGAELHGILANWDVPPGTALEVLKSRPRAPRQDRPREGVPAPDTQLTGPSGFPVPQLFPASAV